MNVICIFVRKKDVRKSKKGRGGGVEEVQGNVTCVFVGRKGWKERERQREANNAYLCLDVLHVVPLFPFLQVLFVGGAGLSDKGENSASRCDGLTAWRVLSGAPHLKLLNDLDGDQSKVSICATFRAGVVCMVFPTMVTCFVELVWMYNRTLF